jgi:hypothetical protein
MGSTPIALTNRIKLLAWMSSCIASQKAQLGSTWEARAAISVDTLRSPGSKERAGARRHTETFQAFPTSQAVSLRANSGIALAFAPSAVPALPSRSMTDRMPAYNALICYIRSSQLETLHAPRFHLAEARSNRATRWYKRYCSHQESSSPH